MRRPIAFIFLSFISGIAVEFHLKFGLHFLVFITVLSLLLLFFSFFYRQARSYYKTLSLFLLIGVLGCWYFYAAASRTDPLETQAGENCTVTGRVITYEVKSEYGMQFLMRSGGWYRLVCVKGILDHPHEMVGRNVQVYGTVEIPPGSRNPKLFDYQLYLKTKGVHVILRSEKNQIFLLDTKGNPLANQLSRFKHYFTVLLQKSMTEEAHGIFIGMLFGDRSLMSDDLYESFQKNGIAHILSVSGIHVGILYLYISKLLGGRKSMLFYGISLLILTFYAALAEFSPSVVRAELMIVVHMTAKIIYRRYDFTACASAGALAMVLVNPYYLFNVGFQLSYMAVFCLAIVLPGFLRWVDKLEALCQLETPCHIETVIKMIRFLAPLLVIQMGMAPLTAYLFNYFSIASFFVNTPVIVIAGILIPIGISLIPLSFIGGMIFGVGAQAAELFIGAMIRLNDFFYHPGLGFFPVTSPSIGFLFFFYSLLFFLSSEYCRILYQRKLFRKIMTYILIFLILSCGLHLYFGSETHKAGLVFLDVGQGDCLHIKTPTGKNILIDGGGSQNYDVGDKILLPYFLKNGVRSIDLAIVTHHHDDHYLGLVQLAQNLKIKKLGTYEANALREEEILAETGLKKENMLYLTAGERISIEDGIWIEILYPEEQSIKKYHELIREDADENEISLLMKLSFLDMDVLMTGDMGFDGENQILKHYREDPEKLQSDILKIGHHGSRYSTGDVFLKTVDPQIAVFQVGKNNFGHPHPVVIEKCEKKGIMIYRNDLHGAVLLELKKKEMTWHIRTMLEENTRLND
ncbi:DNA internalization-related competence protein ComEC/Rec2 [Sinanaerobacter chloroacetimidivorans]|uniref:DNA internalization-related competence protein ComEC/Rec2 n=1 Tax=Sinanaerobacter chloroacetimidivorans TaxID=2818044 RepID=A0A8J8B4N2_9FIRM|nr:DNA internalization-related competence protein ComEC/Rec2 [Sinanaerobacter chloroacetimidivorans]MBR0599515.1 DNA internalization-related competence protein ComEC/Rec2 [Sinanaerobacter chloroacetimidivorans]